ncbi:cytochrome P450 [Aquibacillus kalidii]|uniref:cytochrome P450 n=1 Tax=Aquibacillus kalidii TaxID=2762597 RepID=UPI001648B7A6|nr:cytochrome P450 [Aquibacillus kalidii]
MSTNQQIPHDKSLDNTPALLQEGYLFIDNRVDRYKSDIFIARILGQQAICMRGKEAAEIFYDTDKFQRKKAAPKRLQQTLFGKNAIQTMDNDAHFHRKLLFMSLLTPDHQQKLANLTDKYLHIALEKWELDYEINLFNEVKKVLCTAACEWAGVPLPTTEVEERAEDFISMIYSFGTIGPEHWEGRRARNRVENWIRGIISEVRSGKTEATKGTALYEMAFYKQQDETHLDDQMAAVELINVLRPIVANATFITFSALALHEYTEEKEKIKAEGKDYLEMFIHEVRRFYPFGPFVGAKVKHDFTWKNCQFNKGTLVMLDLYGTNHDPRLWDSPNTFNPRRFAKWQGGLFDFIPQGGGDPSKGHRCPGEGVTVEVMKVAIKFLVNKIYFEVPNQDFSFSLDQMPTLPKSGFVMRNVRKK